MALAQFTGHVIDNLGNESFPMPTPLQNAITLDRRQAVADLEGPYQRLDSVLRELENTESDSKFSQSRKDGRVDASETFAFKVARFYEALYALVGLDGMAGRVRRSSHRTANGGEVELQDETEGEGEAPEPAAETPVATTETPAAAAGG